jgi:CheY-like chemotaxis protein
VLIVEDNPTQPGADDDYRDPRPSRHLAHDGFEALEAVRSSRPDVMLVDTVPGMDGLEVARCIRHDSSLSGITSSRDRLAASRTRPARWRRASTSIHVAGRLDAWAI